MNVLVRLIAAFVLALVIACGGNNESPEAEIDQAMEDVEEVTEDVEDAMREMSEEMEDGDANEREIAIQDLPEAVSSAIASAYPDYTLEEAEEITNEDGSLSYEVELEKGEEEIEAIFSANGEFLGIEEDDGDEDDDDDHEGHDHE